MCEMWKDQKWILNLVGESFWLVHFSDHFRNVFLFDTSFSKLIKFLINDLKKKLRKILTENPFQKWVITFWIFFSWSSCSEVRFSDSAKNCFRSSILCRSRSWICLLSKFACWPNSAPFAIRSAFSFSMSRCCSRKIRSNSCLSRCAREKIKWVPWFRIYQDDNPNWKSDNSNE